MPKKQYSSGELSNKHGSSREERPKKRQKLALLRLEDERDLQVDIEGAERIAEVAGNDAHLSPNSPRTHIQPRSPELPMSLPVFSLPAAPAAPPKSVLALQGLDQALVEAEVINPSSRLPISPDGDDTRSRLSERTRRRLVELGITELFAG